MSNLWLAIRPTMHCQVFLWINIMPYLILMADDLGYNIFRFTSDVRIGRHPRSDIVLDCSKTNTISRCHATIQHDDQGFLLLDCSLNGTRVNNKMIETHRLRDGDEFQIANYTFIFVEDTAVEPLSKQCQVQINGQTEESGLGETEEIIRCDSILDEVPDHQLKTELKAIGIIIEDDRMLTLFRDVHAISNINVPVLLLGEPGTGKEKVAQALHHFSKAKGKFVAVNCSAIPDNLFESELFGSVKGAFSDAETKPGKLEMADNGTLFLDEIGDMSLACQPKLLRFLECRSISRLGETRVRKLDIRIIAATNQDLNQMTEAQTFRSDLFQRLACIKFKIPPLRERKQDTLPLANFFLTNYVRRYGLDQIKISRQAAQMMQSYYWPGNVRELANIMLNVCVRARGGTIMPDNLTSASEEIGTFGNGTVPAFLSLKDVEKSHIQKALEQTEDNKSKAAALLGISRDTLYKKIRKYNIQ
jgi:transcriptional regulator with PAS, ATPase and Fis domain